jgi:biopolymer transport protein ExbD
MKLESTLPERPGFLHAMPLLDLFGLLLIFLLLGPAFVAQSGVSIELPPSKFQLDRFAEPLVISATASDPPVIFLGHERVEMNRLDRRLQGERAALGNSGERVVLLRLDQGVPVNVQRRLAEVALQNGFRVMLAGRTSRGGIVAPEVEPGEGGE